MMYVNKVHEITAQGGPTAQLLLKRCSSYSDTCTKIVVDILQNPAGGDRFKDFETHLAVPMTVEDN